MPDTQVGASSVDDATLVIRVQGGDLNAFEQLFMRYKGMIYRTALAVTRDSGAAEEVLQDCFLKTYQNINRINTDVPLSPWLHRVAVNLSCNVLKKRRSWLEPLENLAERLFADPSRSPEQAAEHSELSATLQRAINKLPLKHRVVVVLHYLQEFSLPEISYILDCPVGTVKSRLHYARQVLRISLEKEFAVATSPGAELTREIIYDTQGL